jgi:hypothetical protein
LGATLVLTQAGGVIAQTPPPIERTPEMEAYAAELAELFPETLAGVSFADNLDIDVGQELLAELDPSDPDDAREIAMLDEMVAAAGVSIDDAATVGSWAQPDDETWVYLAGFKVRGGDIEPTVPFFLEAFQQDSPDVLIEPGQVGGEDVTLLSSTDAPEENPTVLMTRGDMLWMLMVPAEDLEEIMGQLPE